MKNLKKLFASVASIAILATVVPVSVLGAASYSAELEEAYDYAYNVGATTISSIDGANMYGTLTRAHMAKMMVNRAKEVKDLEADTDKTCEFNDIASQTQEMKDYIEKACQMGIMGVGITAFNPNGAVTRAQFGTVLSRVLRGDENEGGDPYYKNHLEALKDAGIMNNISNPMANEIRGYVMLMMMRADSDSETPEICETPQNQTACSLGLDTCPEECVEDEDDNTVKAGSLAVALESSKGGDTPYLVSSLPVATYTLEAGDEDVTLEGVSLEQGGYSEDGTLDGAALFIDGQRVSKMSDIDTDEELTLSLTKAYEIKAGESVELEVRVSIPTNPAAPSNIDGDKFDITLTAVDSTAEDVDMDDDLTSATYTILNKTNAVVNVIKGTTEDLTLGEEASDLFDFKVEGDDNQDVGMSSITFKATDSDFNEYFENFVLEVDGDEVAEGTVNGKYVTFNFEDKYLIEDSENETFTVVADVIGGAAKSVDFFVEKTTDITAIGAKYNVPAYVEGNGGDVEDYVVGDNVTVKAGDISLTKTNPGSTSIIRNRTNLSLGAFTIKNNAGGAVTLQDFDLTFTETGTGTIANILKNVKVRIGSTTAALRTLEDSNSEATWSEEDLGKSIGSSLTIYVYADTEDVDMTDRNFTMKLENVVIEETADEETVTDVTPSTLTFSTMKGSDSELKLTNTTLAAKSVAKGAEDVDAVSFKIKTSTTEGAKISKLTFTAPAVLGDWDNSGATADTTLVVNSDTISAASLYVGTKEYSADVKNGSIVVDEDITLSKDTTTSMVLKVTFESNPTIVGKALKYSLASIEAKDTSADRNTLTVDTSAIAGRNITVQGSATLSLSYESAATNNKYAKSILAGTTATVAEYEVYSNYEAANVGEASVEFNTALIDSVTDVELYYDGTLVANNPTWTNSNKTATFENLDFDIAMAEKLLTVKLVTTTIDADGGAAVEAAKVVKVTLADLQGVSSSDAMDDEVLTADSSLFDIAPATVFAAISDVTATTAKLNLTVNRGSNTDTDNVGIKVKIADVLLSVAGNNGGLSSVRIADDANTTICSRDVSGNTLSSTQACTDTLVSAGTTTWTVYATQSGAIDNPSYTLSLNGVLFTTSKDAYSADYSDRAGIIKTIISK